MTTQRKRTVPNCLVDERITDVDGDLDAEREKSHL